MFERDEKRKNRWYFGGLGGCGSICITHPLDLIKVQLQTIEKKTSIPKIIKNIVKKNGIIGLYSGISASLFRQMIATTARFGIYEVQKQALPPGPLTIMTSIRMSSISGIISGLVGNPADVVNIRLQNDVRLPPEKRRNYKHIIDGLMQISKAEGISALFKGVIIATTRSCLISVFQLTTYDHIKLFFLNKMGLSDGSGTHFLSSTAAATASLLATQPLDVVKTRIMNSKPGVYKNYIHAFQSVWNEGFGAFYKGITPSFLRLAPQTILTFIFMEQLRLHFGYYARDDQKSDIN